MKNLVSQVIVALMFASASIAIAAGGPSKEFLGAELYVVAGSSPMAGGISVHQIVESLGKGNLQPARWGGSKQKP